MNKIKLLLLVCSLVLFNIAALAQTRTIFGNVKDSKTGEPVPGATIKVLHSEIGTSADTKGSFRIEVPTTLSKVVLSVSGVGYTTVEITPQGENVTIGLTLENKLLTD